MSSALKIPCGQPRAGSSPAFGTNILYILQFVTVTPSAAQECHKISLGVKIIWMMQTIADRMQSEELIFVQAFIPSNNTYVHDQRVHLFEFSEI